ncbi:MAG: efflux RND transporter periplasmic adaptor subunit, partial [Burkholderiales bacterium]
MAETSPGARAPASSSRRWLWRFVVLLILAAGAGGFVALQKFKPQPAVRVPVKQLPLVRVESLALRQGRLTVVGHGLVRPHTEVVIGAEVAGRVVYVSPSLISGGRVRKGETVIRLDAEPLRAALAQAEADLRAARAALGLAEQSVRRTEELIAQGFLSRQTLDERLANRDQARAVLARGEAITRQRRLDVARTEIRSPFHGQVLSERVDVGEAVQPGREPVRHPSPAPRRQTARHCRRPRG